jgi:hypothetical protein
MDDNLKYLNIYLIWGLWYTQTFIMLVVMLNFIIAVINQTYEQVKNNQELIHYQYRASINLECFEVLEFLSYDKEFSVILVSAEADQNSKRNDPNKLLIN